jgi:hypothetical protein
MKYAYLKILVFCAALGLFLGNPLHALEFNLVDGEPIHSQADMDSLKTGDMLVMTCMHCKSGTMMTYSSDPSSPGHVNWMQPGATKACTSCGGTMKAVKEGDRIKIVCSKCGDMGYVTAYRTSKN